MKTILEIIKNPKFITTILIILIVSSLCYWHEYRPYKITKHCSSLSTSKIKDSSGLVKSISDASQLYNYLYKRCLNEYGLK